MLLAPESFLSVASWPVSVQVAEKILFLFLFFFCVLLFPVENPSESSFTTAQYIVGGVCFK